MKILVLGANGMAGHTISRYMKEKGYDVFGLSIVPIDFLEHSFLCDLTDKNAFVPIINQGNFDYIINCVGILNQVAEEHKDTAIYLNSYLPHSIVEIIKNQKTKLIHMSTDCVFSGKKGEYSETSFPDGRTYYDRTKALGEVNDNKNLTFRNSIIGPDINSNGIGLFNWFMKQKGTINGYSKAIWTGVSTLTLAKAMEQAMAEDLTGIYNLVNNEKISKLGLLKLFNKYMRDESLTILPSDTINLNKSLINNRSDFSFKVPSYEQMIAELQWWISGHKELYPHYFE